MPMQRGISPSVMCADLLHLERDICALEQAGSVYFHFDIMDGAFVPNFTLSPDVVKAVRRVSSVPADIHMMVNEPQRFFDLLELRPDDVVSIHYEAVTHLQRALAAIRERGAHPALALNPATPLEMVREVLPDIDMLLIMAVNPGFAGQKLIPQALDKIARARILLDHAGRGDVLIQVDGNVSFDNAVKMAAAGADIFVAGTSAVFKPKEFTIAQGMDKLRAAIKQGEGART